MGTDGLLHRRLCAKLYLRGDTQVIDRILIEISRRYFEHNPNCPLGSASASLPLTGVCCQSIDRDFCTGNVYQLVYSLLLLNTDPNIV